MRDQARVPGSAPKPGGGLLIGLQGGRGEGVGGALTKGAPPLLSPPPAHPNPAPLLQLLCTGEGGGYHGPLPAVGLGAGPRKCGGLDLKEGFRGLHPDPVCPPRRLAPPPPRRGLPPAYQWALASGGV